MMLIHLSNALQQTLTEMMRGVLMLMLAIVMMVRIHFCDDLHCLVDYSCWLW